MRPRTEIEEEVAASNADHNGSDTIALLHLEILMDIRDLLVDLYNAREGVVLIEYEEDSG